MVTYLSLLIPTYVIQSTKLHSIAGLSWGSLLWFGTAHLLYQACYLATSWTTLFRTFARACWLLSLFIFMLYSVFRVQLRTTFDRFLVRLLPVDCWTTRFRSYNDVEVHQQSACFRASLFRSCYLLLPLCCSGCHLNYGWSFLIFVVIYFTCSYTPIIGIYRYVKTLVMVSIVTCDIVKTVQ